MKINQVLKLSMITAVLILVSSIPVFALDDNEVIVKVNGDTLDIYDYDQYIATPGIIVNGRTLMPLRKMFNVFNVEPEWNGSDRSITAQYGNTNIWLKIDEKVAKVEGEEVLLDVPAQIVNNRTYVPLRFITETFGVEPEWDGETRTVSLLVETTNLEHVGVEFVLANVLDYEVPFRYGEEAYVIEKLSDSNDAIFIESNGPTLENIFELTERGNYEFGDDLVPIENSDESIFKSIGQDKDDKKQITLFVKKVNNKYIRVYSKTISEKILLEIIKSMK